MHFEIPFFGHENIRAMHKTTIEITKDSHLTTNGGCIIGINAKTACKDIPLEIKQKLKDPKSIVKFSVLVGDYSFTISGTGHNDLALSHPADIVIRKSNYVCPRTLAINCDKSSDEIPRKMIKLLQNSKTKGILLIDVA